MVAYAGLGELIPLYPLYALLFADSGLDGAQISSLFVIWSVTTFVLEVPSGAWADTVDRRRLLAGAAVVNGAGFALWLLAPSFAGFAVGFVLWGLGSAMASGTFESLVYDELAAAGAESRYAQVSGWATAAGLLAMTAATLAAAPLVVLGGFGLVGGVSVVVCAAQAGLALTLPPAPAREAAGGPPLRRYAAMLRAGVAEATTRPAVRAAVLLTAVMYGFLAFDEYFGLLFAELGAGTALVAVLLAVTAAAQAVGGLLAGPAARLSGRALGALTAAAAVLIAVGASSGLLPATLGIGLGYGVLQLVLVVVEARMQEAVEGPARATVTSVAGLSSEVLTTALFVGFGLGSVWLGWATLVAVFALAPLLAAPALARWLPAAADHHDDEETR